VKLKYCFATIALFTISGCQKPRNVVVPPIPPSDILALAPELALNQKPILGDNGLETVISDYEILPYEAKNPYERGEANDYEKLTKERKKIILSECSTFLESLENNEKLEWGLPINKGPDRTYPQISTFISIGRYLSISSRIALEIGDVQFAIRLFLAGRRMTFRLDKASNTISAFSVACSIAKETEKNASFLLDDNRLSLSDLKLIFSNYELDPDTVGLELGFRGEWEGGAYWVATIRFPQDVLATMYSPSHGEPDAKELEGFRGNKNPFDRIATGQELAYFYRMIIVDHDYEGAEKYSKELSTRIPEDLLSGTDITDKTNAWKQLTPNSFGILYNSMVLSDWLSSYHQTEIETQVLRDLNRVKVACLIYRKNHGRFPASLDLLQEFKMKRGVVDRFSGQPFGYNASRKVLWSVGKDRVNNLGAETSPEPVPENPRAPVPLSAQKRLLSKDIVVHLK